MTKLQLVKNTGEKLTPERYEVVYPIAINRPLERLIRGIREDLLGAGTRPYRVTQGYITLLSQEKISEIQAAFPYFATAEGGLSFLKHPAIFSTGHPKVLHSIGYSVLSAQSEPLQLEEVHSCSISMYSRPLRRTIEALNVLLANKNVSRIENCHLEYPLFDVTASDDAGLVEQVLDTRPIATLNALQLGTMTTKVIA